MRWQSDNSKRENDRKLRKVQEQTHTHTQFTRADNLPVDWCLHCGATTHHHTFITVLTQRQVAESKSERRLEAEHLTRVFWSELRCRHSEVKQKLKIAETFICTNEQVNSEQLNVSILTHQWQWTTTTSRETQHMMMKSEQCVCVCVCETMLLSSSPLTSSTLHHELCSCSHMSRPSVRCVDGPVPGRLRSLWLITGTFLLAQTCVFIIAITLRPHSHSGLICSQQQTRDHQ